MTTLFNQEKDRLKTREIQYENFKRDDGTINLPKLYDFVYKNKSPESMGRLFLIDVESNCPVKSIQVAGLAISFAYFMENIGRAAALTGKEFTDIGKKSGK